MKIYKSLFLNIIIFGALTSAQAQGFINLDFESATLVPVPGDPYNSVYFAQAFPGWTISTGGWPNALYNNVFIDSSGISIIDHNWTNYLSSGLIHGGLIQGNYTAVLQAGYGSSGGPTDTSLSQTGVVPVGTQSLLFEAFQSVDGPSAIIPFDVTLGGKSLSLVTISNALNYTLCGADVSAWAGQTVPLTFTAFAENPHHDNQYLFLDGIQFSAQPVPEPSECALLMLGALFSYCQRRRRLVRKSGK